MTINDWKIVHDWMRQNWIDESWEEQEVDEYGLYYHNSQANLWFSIREHSFYLELYVGCRKPKHWSVGAVSDYLINSPYDVIDFLKDNLETTIDRLDEYVAKQKNRKFDDFDTQIQCDELI